jgi:hypothetical protein
MLILTHNGSVAKSGTAALHHTVTAACITVGILVRTVVVLLLNNHSSAPLYGVNDRYLALSRWNFNTWL